MTDLTALKYTAEHEWVALDGDVATVGITDYAADKLGDVVFVELPAVGSPVTAATVVGEIESTKSVGELYAPVSGEVVEVNDALPKSPDLVNSDPYGKGWMLVIRLSDPKEVDSLMSAADYQKLTADGAH